MVQQQFDEQEIVPENYYPIIRGRLTHINEEKLLQKEREDDGAKLRGENAPESEEPDAAENAHTSSKEDSSDSAESEKPEEEQPRMGIGRELNLTFTEKWAENNTLLEGQWMPEGVANQVSVEQGVAERLQIKLADKLTFLIGAREVTVEVTSIREVNWNSFQPNFFMIFSNDVLADFPATYITSFHLPKEKKLWLNDLLKQHPTISIIDVEAMLTQIQETIAQVAIAIRFVLVVVVAAATLVLLAQVQSSLDERRKETVIYRTLGAKGRMIQQAIVYEFIALGAIAGLIAATVAEVSLFLLQNQMFDMSWQLHPELWLIGPVSGAIFVALVGGLSTRGLMKMTPSELIRQLS
jgi:putative ABC transport system permease protein